MSIHDNKLTTGVSYWQVFRLIFVVFSFYLLGDAFFRWDGFKYYASFSEFLPSVALATILCSIMALFIAIGIWLPLSLFAWLCRSMDWKIKIEHAILFAVFFMFSGVMVWAAKRYLWLYVPTNMQIKIIVILCVSVAATFMTWLFRNRAESLTTVVQEHITPLVWLFGIVFMLSIPLLSYHTWIKDTDTMESKKILQTGDTTSDRPNILLVTFDSLTTRDMSVYDYGVPTTPFITEWSKEASLFTRTYSEGNITAPTTSSLMTGKRLWTHQTYAAEDGTKPVKGKIENIAAVLKRNGYYTMAFVANRVASVQYMGVADSFDVAPPVSELRNPVSIFGVIDKLLYDNFGNKIKLHDWILKKDFILHWVLYIISQNTSKTIAPPESVFFRFLWTIDENPQEPYFAWVHLLPPHDPYLPPEPFMGMFESSPELMTLKEQKKLIKNHTYPKELQSSVDILRSRYNEFIRYCDKQFEEFIAHLNRRNELDQTVIILSADHGESFEHDYVYHGGPHLYEQLLNIPLIVKERGQKEGKIIPDLTEQIDISATILDIANVQIPSWIEGRSLLPLMKGHNLDFRPIFSMALQSNPSRGQIITKGTISVWEEDLKLIHYLEENRSLLFNLKKDPDELNNIYSKEPEKSQELLELVTSNLNKANKVIQDTASSGSSSE